MLIVYAPKTKDTRRCWPRATKLCALIALAAVLCALFGCVSSATMAREEGFNAQWRGFASIPPATNLYREAEITIKVVVVGDLSKIGYPGATATYSHPQGVIRIIGKQAPDGSIILPEAVIGHEALHALQFQVGGFANPDRLGEWGY